METCKINQDYPLSGYHEKVMKTIVWLVIVLFTTSGLNAQSWSWQQRGNILEIGYGGPQYAALHLNDSYFRMNYGPQSSWGTSVILMPSFWSGGIYYQGAPVEYNTRVDGSDLLLTLTGTIRTLQVNIQVRLFPPGSNELRAQVSANLTGSVALDNRPGEAFKPVMLSSMRISSQLWDTQLAYVDCRSYAIPPSGWVIHPPTTGKMFGLLGGTSAWKPNAPTMEVTFPQAMTVTGWVTSSSNPNDDNVGFWAATSVVMNSWSYTLRCAPLRTYDISGQVTLQEYSGSPTSVPVTIELLPAGGTTPIRTETVNLTASGGYTLSQVPPGTYDLAFRASHWLHCVRRHVQVVNACVQGANISLINGDATGDSRIDDADLLRVLFDFGSTGTNLPADLNGDGQVNDRDLLIVLFNFGREC